MGGYVYVSLFDKYSTWEKEVRKQTNKQTNKQKPQGYFLHLTSNTVCPEITPTPSHVESSVNNLVDRELLRTWFQRN